MGVESGVPGLGSGTEPWIMNHSGFKGLKVASAVGSRIQGDAWGFHWSKKRPAGVGYAGLWGLPNRGLYLRSRGSHWKVFIIHLPRSLVNICSRRTRDNKT